MKRVLALICAIIMTFTFCISGFAVTLDYNSGDLKIGSLHDLNTTDYKFSWLNKLVVRDDANAVTTARMVPYAAYPYSRTYDQFLVDIQDCMMLYEFDESNVEQAYKNIINVLYYTAVSLGMTTDQETMLKYLKEQNIAIPANMTSEDTVEAAVVYAALKYNLTYAIFGRETTFVKGRTIEGAVVDILATATEATLPSGIDTVQGLAVYCCKSYAESYDGIPMSDNPSQEEVFYLVKLIASAKKGYDVPEVDYESATDIQKQYVDCTYYATVLGTLYDIQINPLELAQAAQSNDVLDVARLVLETMFESIELDYDANDTVENLFVLACENGFFDMEEEFYSDVYNYDVYVDNDCEKLWLTPFSLAKQLEGEEKYVTIKIGDKTMSPSTTYGCPLDMSKDEQNVVITVTYDDGEGNSDMTIYALKVIREEAGATSTATGVAAEIEDMLNDVVPQESEKGKGIVSEVVSAVDSAVSEGQSAIAIDSSETKTSETTEPTTYAIEETTAETSTTLSDFDYFSQLVDETYGSEIVLTSKYDQAEEATTEKSNDFISNAVETVKENPEVVAVPSSVVAVGALAGYLFTKKKKTVEDVTDEETNSDDND